MPSKPASQSRSAGKSRQPSKSVTAPDVEDLEVPEEIDPEELKAAIAAAQAEGSDDDEHGGDESDGGDEAAQDGSGAEAGSSKKPQADAAAKRRIVRQSGESEEDYKQRLKAELRRRKHEKKKAAKAVALAEQQATVAARKEEKQRAHAERMAAERAAKALRVEREKELEGLTNKQKRQKRKEWALEDAASNPAVVSSTSNDSVTDSAEAATKKGKSSAAASASAAAAASKPAKPAAASASSVAPASKAKPSSENVPLPAHSAWEPFNLHPAILRSLLVDLKFHQPTPIQEAVLTPAIRDWKDVSAAATTGSGKTLAFGIPIVHRLLTLQEAPGWEDPKRIQALILTPTRELALQIVSHLEAIAAHASPPIRIAPIVGGMAPDKQKRVLEQKHPAIVVATPGRLWELIQLGELQHLSTAYYLRFLVFDEADRMVEGGHFSELTHILEWIERNSTQDSVTYSNTQRKQIEQFDGFEMLEDGDEQKKEEEEQDGVDADESKPAEEANLTAMAQREAKAFLGRGRPGRTAKPKDSGEAIDWNSFLTEEQIFKQRGMKAPKERRDIEHATGESDEEEQDEDADADEQDGDGDDADADLDQGENEDGAEEAEQLDADESDEKSAEEDAESDAEMADAEAASKPSSEEKSSNKKQRLRRQIFLFSATLMLPTAGREDASKLKKKRSRREPATVLEKLADKITFQHNSQPLVVDLSSTHQVADTLEEVRADCLKEDKDFMVYYFLLLYPGKTLVFVNSISCLRRLVQLLTICKLPAFALHAEMQQKARLKALERFKEGQNTVLVCTDVAARGLDIPRVPYIIHYQLPRTPEIYIHRSGRVARAGAEGLSFALVSEDETKIYRRLCLVLKKPDGLPALPIDGGYLRQIRERMVVARDLDKYLHQQRKAKTTKEWFQRSAEAMEMEFDPNELQLESDSDEGADQQGAKEQDSNKKEQAVKAAALQKQLDHLLAKPLVHSVLNRKFYTLNSGRGFDLNAESAKIAAAGAEALGQAEAMGLQDRSVKKLPGMLQKARQQQLAHPPSQLANKQNGNAKTHNKTQSAASSRPVVSLSAKRKQPEPSKEDDGEELGSSEPVISAPSTASSNEKKKLKKQKL